ncbi:MAG: DUF3240 family protein [Deltaproteobacteria bacterium]|nr:DUF3240 family protein [Deltaproteobacteria bacterium]
MKCLSLVVNKSKQDEILSILRATPQVTAYTIFHGEGHYRGSVSIFESADDEVMGYVPRIRIDLLLADNLVDEVLNKLKECRKSATSFGIYWITPIDKVGEL